MYWIDTFLIFVFDVVYLVYGLYKKQNVLRQNRLQNVIYTLEVT